MAVNLIASSQRTVQQDRSRLHKNGRLRSCTISPARSPLSCTGSHTNVVPADLAWRAEDNGTNVLLDASNVLADVSWFALDE